MGWAILRLQPGPAGWIFFVLLPDLGSCFVLVLAFGARARTTSPGGHVCARDHLIQSVTGRTTGGFPLLQLWRPKALEHCDGKPTGVAGYDG